MNKIPAIKINVVKEIPNNLTLLQAYHLYHEYNFTFDLKKNEMIMFEIYQEVNYENNFNG